MLNHEALCDSRSVRACINSSQAFMCVIPDNSWLRFLPSQFNPLSSKPTTTFVLVNTEVSFSITSIGY